MYGSNLTYTKINWCIGLTVHETNVTVHALFMGPTTTLFRKKIKNGSHSTIHTFKNYFATVFSVFNFSNNKFNPNGPEYHKKKIYLIYMEKKD